MKSKKLVLISVLSTAALLASVGVASAATNFSHGQFAQKPGIAFSKMKNNARRAGFGGTMSSVMSVVAQDLNISTQTLQADLSSGKSINDIATAQGVDTSKLATDVQAALTANINQEVQSGKITSAQATTMESKLAQQVQNILSQTRRARGNRGPAFGGSMGSIMSTVAKDLNISTQTLISDLSSGKSINDIATAQGVDATKLAQDVQAALTANINKEVQSGKINSAQASTIESKLDQQVQKILSQTRPAKYNREPGSWRGYTRNNSGSQNTTTSNTTSNL